MRLVLLGAGASHGASQFGNTRPPLVTGILPCAVELGMFSPGYAEGRHAALANEFEASGALPAFVKAFRASGKNHLQPFREFIHQQFDCTPDRYAEAKIDFERLFALTEAELLGWHALLRYLNREPSNAQTPDLLDMQIKLVLCGTLIASTRDHRCAFHDALARWLHRGDVVVSFNYDLLIDRSLAATGIWHQDDGYGLRFKQHLRRDNGRAVWRDHTETSSGVSLIKPHGSLNWLYPRNSWDSVMNMTLQPGHKIKPAPPYLYCLNDMYSNFEDDYPTYEWWERYDVHHDDFVFDLHSLIVPPTLSKPYRMFEHFMGPLWGAVSDALLNAAEEVFVIGYSLREDDVRTHWLLRKAAREGKRLRKICVVDPADSVVERASKLFSPLKVSKLCNTIGEFAELTARGAV